MARTHRTTTAGAANEPCAGESRPAGWLDSILILWALIVVAGFLWERVAGSETFAHLRHLIPGG